MNLENLLLLVNDCPSTHFHSLNDVFFPDVHTTAELFVFVFKKLAKSFCSCWLQMIGRVDPLSLHRLHASVQINLSLLTLK